MNYRHYFNKKIFILSSVLLFLVYAGIWLYKNNKENQKEFYAVSRDYICSDTLFLHIVDQGNSRRIDEYALRSSIYTVGRVGEIYPDGDMVVFDSRILTCLKVSSGKKLSEEYTDVTYSFQ